MKSFLLKKVQVFIHFSANPHWIGVLTTLLPRTLHFVNSCLHCQLTYYVQLHCEIQLLPPAEKLLEVSKELERWNSNPTKIEFWVNNNKLLREFQTRLDLNWLLGTPDYLAPELLLHQPHSSAVDWWSLGVCLYELLIGFPPFTDETKEKVFQNILQLNLEFPDQPEEKLSDEAEAAVIGLLNLDPEQRVHNLEMLQQDVKFFKDVKWGEVLNREAPFVPEPVDEVDTGYFQARNDLLNLRMSSTGC